MAARRKRMLISPLGEYYEDILRVDAWINARSVANQATSLLGSKLQEREERVKARVNYLAKKRGVGSDELWREILLGEAERIEPDEMEWSDDDDDDE